MLDLSHYDEMAAPATNSGNRLGANDLPDGDYEFEIKKVYLKTSKKQQTPIISMELQVLSGPAFVGNVIERPSFITSQEAFGFVLADCLKLGFDADQWKKATGRPASQEIEKAAKLMEGLRFAGQKKTNGTYHNVYIDKRLNTDGKPAKFTAADLDAAPKDPF